MQVENNPSINQLLKMILMILDGCNDLDEAKEKIIKILAEEKSQVDFMACA